jgi:hypothetical protein
MFLKVSASKLSVILLERLKNELNKKSLINYNQSGCVKQAYEIVHKLESQGKKIDWENVNLKISRLNFSPQEEEYKQKITTLSITEETKNFICITLTAELSNIYGNKRIYASTALNFLLAAGYLQFVLRENIEVCKEENNEGYV